jgi:hypothetical protein
MRSLLAICMIVGISFASGCSKDPGSMSKADIEVKLKETLELRDVSLTESPDGGYTGSGMKDDGTKFTISVIQKKNDKLLWYSATDDRGDVKAGGFQEFSRWGIDSTAIRGWRILKLVVVALLIAGIACYAIWRKRLSAANTRRLAPKDAEPGAAADGGA